MRSDSRKYVLKVLCATRRGLIYCPADLRQTEVILHKLLYLRRESFQNVRGEAFSGIQGSSPWGTSNSKVSYIIKHCSALLFCFFPSASFVQEQGGPKSVFLLFFINTLPTQPLQKPVTSEVSGAVRVMRVERQNHPN